MKNKGFTLVELMVVIVILGILAAIGGSTYSEQVTKAKVNEIVTFEKVVREEIVKYTYQGGAWDGIDAHIQANYGSMVGVDRSIADVEWTTDTALIITFNKLGKVPSGSLNVKAVVTGGGFDWTYSKSFGDTYDNFFPMHLRN